MPFSLACKYQTWMKGAGTDTFTAVKSFNELLPKMRRSLICKCLTRVLVENTQVQPSLKVVQNRPLGPVL